MEVVSDLSATGIAGQVAASFVVRVADANGQPLSGVLVDFTPVVGAPRLDVARDTRDAEGVAATTVTLSTTPGPNQIQAGVAGLRRVRSTSSVGSVIAARGLSFSPRPRLAMRALALPNEGALL